MERLRGVDAVDRRRRHRRRLAIKQVGRDGSRSVELTLDRSQLWAVQTPQVFRREALIRALAVVARAASAAATDASRG